MLQIKVLGPGCANCKRLEQLVSREISKLGFAANIEKVTDYAEIMGYGIMSTPGLVINGQVVCYGRVPSNNEVGSWLASAEKE